MHQSLMLENSDGSARCCFLALALALPPANSGQEGYGAFIGTAMIASFLQMGLSFVPKK